MDFAKRMKLYESPEINRKIIPGLPIYIRLDGRCFSKFTENMDKPYDHRMTDVMIETTKALVKETNAAVGYTQSDEISLVLENENNDTDFYFDRRISKITSVLAGITSSAFVINYVRIFKTSIDAITEPVSFDCRVIPMPSKTEVANMILWRELDATRNAIISAARSVFSHKEILNKNYNELQEMLFSEHSINFNDYPSKFKRGSFVKFCEYEKFIDDEVWNKIPEHKKPKSRKCVRRRIEVIEMPSFSKVTNREDVIFDGAKPNIGTSL